MKILLKIVLTILLSISIFSISAELTFADLSQSTIDLETGDFNNTISNGIEKTNDPLQSLKNATTDFTVNKGGQVGIYNSLIRIARDVKNLFFIIAGVYFLVLVIKLLFSEKTEEEATNFKKGIIWISIGIVITQISYYFVNVLFDKQINVELSYHFIQVIIEPIIKLLETGASFFFLAIMFYAFFALVTSNGDEEKAKSGKMAVLYGAIGFIVVKLSKALVSTTYGKTNCSSMFQTNCMNTTDLNGFAGIVVRIIDWMNSFIGIIIILMIIYAGFTVITSAGDEEKLKKAKSSIIYIAIGLFILFANYLILTFFILPPAGVTI